MQIGKFEQLKGDFINVVAENMRILEKFVFEF